MPHSSLPDDWSWRAFDAYYGDMDEYDEEGGEDILEENDELMSIEELEPRNTPDVWPRISGPRLASR